MTERWRSVTRREPCPVCGRDHNCSIAPGNRAVACARTDGGRRCRDGRYLHWLVGAAFVPRPPRRPPGSRAHDLDAREVRRRHAAYRRLLALCPLSEAHGAQLRARGMSEEEVAARGYATLRWRYAERTPIAEAIAAEVGALDGVPGFHRAWREGPIGTLGETWSYVGSDEGLVVPVRNAAGRIVALRMRVEADEVHDPRTNQTIQRPKRYLWFSSGNREGGTASGAPTHVARPRERTDDRVWITEGEIKADLAAWRLGADVLSCPGVSLWRSEDSTLFRELAALDRKGVVLAFDRDDKPATAEHVRMAEFQLGHHLLGLGYDVGVACWFDHKGLDDALVAGAVLHVPTLVEAQRDDAVYVA